MRGLVLAVVLVLASAIVWAYATGAPFSSALAAPRPPVTERAAEPTLVLQPIDAGVSPTSAGEADPELALLSSSVDAQGRYAVVEGTVQNLSERPLRSVMASVVLYDEGREPHASADALIQENPLMPGQVSTWRVTLKNHPEYPLYGVEFRAWHIGTIPTRDDR